VKFWVFKRLYWLAIAFISLLFLSMLALGIWLLPDSFGRYVAIAAAPLALSFCVGCLLPRKPRKPGNFS
jgi:hypothetical protein